MKSLAFFSPLSPLRSGVAHYGDALAKELSKYYEIIFYIDDGYTPSDVGGIGEVLNFSRYRGKEDMALFQASNGPLHAYMYPFLLEGGVAMTLHDRTLHDMAVKYWEGKSRLNFWMDFMATEGLGGLVKSIAPLPEGGGSLSERIMHNLYLDEADKRLRFKFFKRVVRRSIGFVAHSNTVRDAALGFGAGCPSMVTPLGVETAPPAEARESARKSLELERFGIGDDTFAVLAFGFIQRHKRILPLLDSWRAFTRKDSKARMILLGPRSPELDIDAELDERGLADRVVIDDSFPPMEVVNRYLFASDLCVNLRWPVYGSSSYSLMQILAAGRPCLVTDAETFSEFGDDCVIKVSHGEGEAEAILKVLGEAKENPARTEAIGENARRFVEAECTWQVVGERYHRFLEKVYK